MRKKHLEHNIFSNKIERMLPNGINKRDKKLNNGNELDFLCNFNKISAALAKALGAVKL